MNPNRTDNPRERGRDGKNSAPAGSATPDDTAVAFGFDRTTDDWLEIVRDALTVRVGQPDEGVADDQDEPGQRIGPYELLSRIGMGGMGTVWRARRADKRPDRVVALKLIRDGMHSRSTERRFRLEEQVLARLTHPGIARLYDAGVSASGRPYLVMEYVEGESIQVYAREHASSVEERLSLFRRICEAVQYAHSALVLHRDIKPGNILVSPDGTPKLLDFGIAKLLDDSDESAANMTATDMRVLTPRYASPEQVRGEQLTTATDVYSLGVIFYELVSGTSPYDGSDASRRAIERAVCEQVPQRPSTAVRGRDDLSNVEKRRMAWRLRGDLDTICATALQKDPRHRYHTPGEMAEDMRRHLEGLPLLARRAGFIARSLRLLRRRRGAVFAALGGMVASAVAGTLIVIYLFLIPGWVDDHVQSARRELVARTGTNGIYNILFFNTGEYRTRAPIFNSETGVAALLEYDAALRLGDVGPAARIERDLLVIGEALANAPDQVPVLAQAIEDELPLTARYARGWAADGVVRYFDEEEIAQADQPDIRALGFLAFQCGNYEMLIEAWSRLDIATADPLAELLQGYVYLALDEGALAYPRLLAAHRAYPHQGSVMVCLADAAARCGDVEQAEALVDRARAMAFSDKSYPLVRIEMLILLHRGAHEDAMKLYDSAGLGACNPVATVQLARYFEEQGDYETALQVLGERVVEHGKDQASDEKLSRLMEAWWSGLAEDRKADTLANGLRTPGSSVVPMAYLLRAYATASGRLQRSQQRTSFDWRARWATLVYPISEDRLTEARSELLSLAADYESDPDRRAIASKF